MLHYLCLIKKEKQRKEDNLVYANLCKIIKKKFLIHINFMLIYVKIIEIIFMIIL